MLDSSTCRLSGDVEQHLGTASVGKGRTSSFPRRYLYISVRYR